ncbi:type II toxin-antitoxin system RelE/ParE family toxin [bacterium]|nr:type II toxin-antitoxin system RelE/ParE family toxin [bacterium]
MKIVWTENAVQDLLSIKEYISLDSSVRAEQWILVLYNAGEDLINMPHRGRVVPEFNRDEIRELLIENYRLVYRVKAKCIEVLTVFEGHRSMDTKAINKKPKD